MKISITVNNENNAFIIKPVDFSFSKLRGINVFVKSINNGFLNDGSIEIPFLDSDVNQIYSQIVNLFTERWSCEILADGKSDLVIFNAQEEEEKFKQFAKKAFEIRNNDIAIADLESFVGILDRNIFVRTLKPFQLLAAYHLAFSQNACNFSVPGSGKTSTVLAAYEILKSMNDEKKKVDKILVVGPLSSFMAWKSEYKECYERSPVCLEIHGGVTADYVEDRLLRSNVKEEIVLVSYGSLEGRKEIITRFLKQNRVMVVLDEAHRIKNVEGGIQSRIALSLSPYAKARVVLTGTPAANSYVDLYNLYKFIWPAKNIIGYSIIQLENMSKQDNDLRVLDLIQRISPFYIRVRKKDLKLPEPIFHEPKRMQMSNVQRIIYEAIEDMAMRTFEQTAISDIFRKSAFIRLRQAASNPRLLNKPLNDYFSENEIDIKEKQLNINEMEQLDDDLNVDNNILDLIKNYTEVPCKFVEAYDLSSRIIASGGKLIIWCEFVGTCEDLSEYLTLKEVQNAILYGKATKVEREGIITEFHDNPDLSVIIANPYAVGESISLHKACHNALYLEQGYNAGVYMQSKDRIHRVGLKESDKTNYFFFHADDSIDDVAYNRVMLKEKRMLELIESEDIPLLSKNEDFMEDLEDDIKAIMRAYYERKKRRI